ncbi:hypothetical protein M422DRAFT_261791 [Sphaerobolus stellatus SS14]|uniref:Uncharacterized protein n=1 Tax=Sphaerobolus stellatus (strain SS14) TaxID=990650 RepID=A0A0C9VE56_SPHS4|nr:hypothetical protein M422DRAFT_261791 [Sphaerobolus stellatus SS14]
MQHHEESQPPTLLDLHASLATSDYWCTELLINILRQEHFPCDTGFEAVVQLVKGESTLQQEDCYVHSAEEYDIR